jgi:hypothetical protein
LLILEGLWWHHPSSMVFPHCSWCTEITVKILKWVIADSTDPKDNLNNDVLARDRSACGIRKCTLPEKKPCVAHWLRRSLPAQKVLLSLCVNILSKIVKGCVKNLQSSQNWKKNQLQLQKAVIVSEDAVR